MPSSTGGSMKLRSMKLRMLNPAAAQNDATARSSFLVDEQGRIEQAWYGLSPEATVPNALAALQG